MRHDTILNQRVRESNTMLAYFLLALSNLKRRGLRSALTLIGIIIGIAAVVSLISLGQGLEQAITGQFSSLSADRLLVQNAGSGFGPPGAFAVTKLTEHDKRLVESVAGIDRVIARYVRTVKVDFNKKTKFEYVSSIPFQADDVSYFYDSFTLEAASGKLLKGTDTGKVLVGSSYAEENEYGKLLMPGTKILINGKSFEVIGVLKKTSTFQFNQALFITETDLKDIFTLKDEIDFLFIHVTDKDAVEQVAADLAEKMRRDRKEKPGEEDFSIQTPVQALGVIKTILTIINLIVGGIAAISLLVGGIGVTNTLFTSVVERTKEIGTMKALGAQNKDIRLIFFSESAVLGFLGGLVGAGLGIGLAFLVSFAANTALNNDLLAVSFSFTLIAEAVGFATLLGIIAGTIPAFQAARLKPMEALRR